MYTETSMPSKDIYLKLLIHLAAFTWSHSYWTIKLGLVMACLCTISNCISHHSHIILISSTYILNLAKSIQKLTCKPGPGGPSPQAPSNRSATGRRAACAPDNARSNGHATWFITAGNFSLFDHLEVWSLDIVMCQIVHIQKFVRRRWYWYCLWQTVPNSSSHRWGVTDKLNT